jgi:hypothetical protein
MKALGALVLAALGGSPDAPPGYVFGRWTALDQQQTYPSAKQIRRAGDGYDLVDLLYGDEESIKLLGASDRRVAFLRSNRLSQCSTRHDCTLDAPDRLSCALETHCGDQVTWRGKRQAQGIPVRCR